MGNQESSREIPVPHRSKISINRCIEEGKKNSFTLPVSPFPKGSIAQCQKKPSQPVISHKGKSESEMSTLIPQPCEILPKRTTSASPHRGH